MGYITANLSDNVHFSIIHTERWTWKGCYLLLY